MTESEDERIIRGLGDCDLATTTVFTGRVRGVAIHEEQVGDYRGRFERFLDRHRSHRHRVIRRTWTLDDSLWADDPNALEFCECGAVRRLWGINNPWWRPQ